MQVLLTLAAATVGGLGAARVGIPGGLIFGGMAGAALVSVVSDRAVAMPGALRSAAFIAVGASLGAMVNRDALAALRPVLLPAVLSGTLLILAGLAIAYLLRLLGLAPSGDVLATSPGALSVLTAMAAEQRVGVVEVPLFHLVRVVMVLASLPLIVTLLDRTAP